MKSEQKYFYETLYNQNGSEWITINWAMSSLCNFRCSYCNPDLHKGREYPSFELVTDFLTKFVAYCKEQHKKPYVIFAGGEISALPYFREMIDLNDKLGIRPFYITNLSKPLSFWQTLPSSNMTFLASFHSEFTNKDEYFEKVKYLDSLPHVQVITDIMIHPDHFDELYNFAMRIRSALSTAIINPIPILENFATAEARLSPKYTDDQIHRLENFPRTDQFKLEQCYSPRAHPRLVTNEGIVEHYNPNELILKRMNNFKGWDCSIGVEQIIVTIEQKIWRGFCAQGGPIGELKSFDFNKLSSLSSIMCKADICACFYDIVAPKKNPSKRLISFYHRIRNKLLKRKPV